MVMGFTKIETTGQRVDFLLEHYGYNDRNFEEACGLSAAAVHKARSEGRLSAETARRIKHRFLEVSLEWLLFGIGIAFSNKDLDKISIIDALNRLSESIDRLNETINNNVKKN